MSTPDRDSRAREEYEVTKFDSDTRMKYGIAGDLVVEPSHWTKFDTPGRIPHPYAHVVQSLGDLSGKTVLEMGCGTGVFSVIMAKRGAGMIHAFDISGESIGVAQRRAVMNNVQHKTVFETASVYAIELTRERYDYIVGLNFLHHVDIERIVQKIHDAMKPGARAFFLEPFANPAWVEKLRLLVPVRVNEVDKSHWQEKIRYSDIDKFRSAFQRVRVFEYHLASRIDRITRNRIALDLAARFDAWMVESFPRCRQYARRVVIELEKG